MSALDDFNAQVDDLEASNNAYFSKKWAPANPSLYDRWSAFKAAIRAGQRPTPPDMAGNRFGEALVDAGVWYLHATTPAPTPTPAPEPPIPVAVGALLFEENFAGPLDPTIWDNKSRVNSYSGTTYQPSNVTIANGMADFKAYKDAAGKWYGAEIQSLDPAHSYIGPRYKESRAKLPAGYGVWPAPIWEWSAPWGEAGIENDTIENLGKEPTKYHVTVHDSKGHSFGKVIDTGVVLSDDFRWYSDAVYGDRIDFYFNRGATKATITKDEAFANGLVDWHYVDTKMDILCDIDMGGAWAGTPTILGPAHMFVDYLRVYALAAA